MRHVRLSIALGVFSAFAVLGACSLDESGSFDSGGPDVIVTNDSGVLDVISAEDVTYDVPDLGVGETESGLPCTCVTSIPAGYNVVEYSATTQGNCSTGYASKPLLWMENPTAGTTTCTCTCSPTPSQNPTCTCGATVDFDVTGGSNNQCNSVAGQKITAGSTCYNTTQNLTSPANSNDINYLKAAVAPNACATMNNAQCGQGAADASIPAYAIDHGESCTLEAGTATCTNNGVCIPTQATAYELCVTNGQVEPSCPFTDFPEMHLVGTSVTDSRACGPNSCSCSVTEAGTCQPPVLFLDTNNGNCNPNSATIIADNTTCTNPGYGSIETINSASYSVAYGSGAACGFTGNYGPTGGLAMSGGYTICCRPQQ